MHATQKMSGRTTNHITYDLKEFLAKKRAKDGFIMDVLKDKKLCWQGTSVSLKRLESQGLIEKISCNDKQIVSNITRARKDLITGK